MLLTVMRLSLSHAGLPSQSVTVGVWGVPPAAGGKRKLVFRGLPRACWEFISPHGLYKGGVAGEVRYRVSFRINPCAERASACRARACIGAEGFIHSEESVVISA